MIAVISSTLNVAIVLGLPSLLVSHRASQTTVLWGAAAAQMLFWMLSPIFNADKKRKSPGRVGAPQLASFVHIPGRALN